MTQKQRVGIAEYRVAKAPGVLVSYGLGSCVAIMLYDPELRLGGLAHTLLPEQRPGMDAERPAKYVSLAIRTLVDELRAAGAAPTRLTAKLCGGAHMFHPPPDDPERTVGQRNVRAARATLAELGLELAAEDVGGSYGRTVEFDLTSGKVLLRFVRGHVKLKEL